MGKVKSEKLGYLGSKQISLHFPFTLHVYNMIMKRICKRINKGIEKGYHEQRIMRTSVLDVAFAHVT